MHCPQDAMIAFDDCFVAGYTRKKFETGDIKMYDPMLEARIIHLSCTMVRNGIVLDLHRAHRDMIVYIGEEEMEQEIEYSKARLQYCSKLKIFCVGLRLIKLRLDLRALYLRVTMDCN